MDRVEKPIVFYDQGNRVLGTNVSLPMEEHDTLLMTYSRWTDESFLVFSLGLLNKVIFLSLTAYIIMYVEVH